MFIGLNPSTADENVDDPTIRRIIGFASGFGYGGVYMTNLFAYRATKPDDMIACDRPIGEDNDDWLKHYAEMCPTIFCAWGAHGGHISRDRQVVDILPTDKLWCLGKTKHGQPRHPLYLKRDTQPVRYQP